MCNQIKGVVWNFIWGGKAIKTQAKVKMGLPHASYSNKGLGIINPKAQSKALLAKLLLKGLSLDCEPWKEILRHCADQVQLLVHGKGQRNQGINWLFVAPKL
jgi:hypothetical protein